MLQLDGPKGAFLGRDRPVPAGVAADPLEMPRFPSCFINLFSQSCMCTFIHKISFTKSPMKSFTNSPMNSFTNSPMNSFTHKYIHEFTHAFTCSHIHFSTQNVFNIREYKHNKYKNAFFQSIKEFKMKNIQLKKKQVQVR